MWWWWKRGLLVSDRREVAVAAGLADSVRAALPVSPEAALPAATERSGSVRAAACHRRNSGHEERVLPADLSLLITSFQSFR
jgi:hypothetical protein